VNRVAANEGIFAISIVVVKLWHVLGHGRYNIPEQLQVGGGVETEVLDKEGF